MIGTMVEGNTALAPECDAKKEFLRLVAALTLSERRELWNELKRCGLIREEVNQ